MGYTHYWEHGAIDAATFAALAADVRLIITASDVPVRGPLGDGAPEVTDSQIGLNGNADFGDECESFIITRRAISFDFCKTNRRPYDEIVGAILLRAMAVVGHFTVSSNGDMEGDDWTDARALYVKAFDVAPPVAA